jgi:hypothetical protein
MGLAGGGRARRRRGQMRSWGRCRGDDGGVARLGRMGWAGAFFFSIAPLIGPVSAQNNILSTGCRIVQPYIYIYSFLM